MFNTQENKTTMENTINTKNVAFVAYNDGTFFIPKQENEKDENLMPAHLFRAIKNYIRTMDNKQTAAMAIGWLVEGSDVPQVLTQQLESKSKDKIN